MNIEIDKLDSGRLMNELERINRIKFNAVCKKNLTQMYNRAKSSLTPRKTGELRMSAGVNDDEVGYTKEYAPHVEYGHRTINGGWVSGQKFLKENVDIQKEIFIEDMKKALMGGG